MDDLIYRHRLGDIKLSVDEDRRVVNDPDGEIMMCMWFASCPQDATHTQKHPILGDVPICDRCQKHYDSH